MKKILLVASIASAVFLSGCETMKQGSVSGAPFVGHQFVLVSVDGAILNNQDAQPMISFDVVKDQPGQIAVSGNMCNNFFGQGQFKDNTLTVKPLGATMRFCSDQQLNQLDRIIGIAFERGAKIQLDGTRLIIEGDNHQLVYSKKGA